MNDALLEASTRMWDAAYALDERRGDSRATDWLAGKVSRMIEGDLPDDVETVERLASALEKQLDRMGAR